MAEEVKRKRGRPRKTPLPQTDETEKEKEKEKEGRDESGRFKKGYKGGGRPKKPKELSGIHKYTIKELIRLSEDEDTPVKTRADILKWLTEMDIGKPRQRVDAEIRDNSLEVEIKVV